MKNIFFYFGVCGLIVPIIGSTNQCFVGKDDMQDDSVPMDVDKDVTMNMLGVTRICRIDIDLDLIEID